MERLTFRIFTINIDGKDSENLWKTSESLKSDPFSGIVFPSLSLIELINDFVSHLTYLIFYSPFCKSFFLMRGNLVWLLNGLVEYLIWFNWIYLMVSINFRLLKQFWQPQFTKIIMCFESYLCFFSLYCFLVSATAGLNDIPVLKTIPVFHKKSLMSTKWFYNLILMSTNCTLF